MRGLNDKRIVITGAAGGIGLACAKRFAEEGARLTLIDLDESKGPALREQLGDDVTYLPLDVTRGDDLQKLEAHLAEVGVDVLVNNAGITKDGTALKMGVDQWQRVLDVNLTAVFRLSQLAGARMRAQGEGGAILNAASVVAHNGNFGQANYVASKSGLIGLTKTLARELGRFGIRVNAIAPGFIDTEMARAVPDEILARFTERTPLGRLGKPEEVAATYAWLASDDASYVTGTVINCDGGLVV